MVREIDSEGEVVKCSRFIIVNNLSMRSDARMEKQVINIPPVELEWSDWFPWDDLKIDARSGGVKVPNRVPGVYEVKYGDNEERLTIGGTNDLRFRIKQGLVKGKTRHSAGKKIRANGDTSKLVVRWAVTSRPHAVEEELHRLYTEKFGKLPKYTKRT